MEFNQGSELLDLCREQDMPISRVMKLRETEFSRISEEEVEEKMIKSLNIMRRSAKEPLTDPKPSVGGLIGENPASFISTLWREGLSAGRCFSVRSLMPWQFWRSMPPWV
ncbi:MAG: hypothetical protein ACLRMZ_03705 [Blautia marasmi]